MDWLMSDMTGSAVSVGRARDDGAFEALHDGATITNQPDADEPEADEPDHDSFATRCPHDASFP
jgi:hypothetical protein